MCELWGLHDHERKIIWKTRGPETAGKASHNSGMFCFFPFPFPFRFPGPAPWVGVPKEGGIQEHTDWEGHRVGCRSIRIFGNEADESFSSMSCEKQFLPANNSTSYCSEK
jgi:hypothetical protein